MVSQYELVELLKKDKFSCEQLAIMINTDKKRIFQKIKQLKKFFPNSLGCDVVKGEKYGKVYKIYFWKCEEIKPMKKQRGKK